MWPCTCRLLLDRDMDPVAVYNYAKGLVAASADPFRLCAGSMPILEVMYRITNTTNSKLAQAATLQKGDLESASTTAVQVSHAKLPGAGASPQAPARCCRVAQKTLFLRICAAEREQQFCCTCREHISKTGAANTHPGSCSLTRCCRPALTAACWTR